jgi:hypothetical protein
MSQVTARGSMNADDYLRNSIFLKNINNKKTPSTQHIHRVKSIKLIWHDAVLETTRRH